MNLDSTLSLYIKALSLDITSTTMNFGNIFLKFRISTSFIIHTFRNHIKIKIKYCNNLNPFFTKAMSVNELGGRKKMRQFLFLTES